MPHLQRTIDYSFVIINFRSASYLEKCVQSLHEKIRNVSFEIIMVNNDSEPLVGFSKVFPDVRIIEHNFNSGFGKANNIAVQSTSGKILAFLNPDTEIIDFNALKLKRYFNENEKVGVVGAKLISENNKPQLWSAGCAPTLIDTLLNNIGLIRSKKIWDSRVVCETDWVSGAAFYIRRNVFEELDGFDEKFFMYFEDADLCLRTRQAGWKIVHNPEITILHHGGKSSDNIKSIKPLFYKSQDYYFEKHRPKWEGSIMKWLRRHFI